MAQIPTNVFYGGGCPKTSDSNSRILQSESLNEVLVPYSGKKAPSNGVQTTFISTDSYKLKVEKTVKGVLGRAGGVRVLLVVGAISCTTW